MSTNQSLTICFFNFVLKIVHTWVHSIYYLSILYIFIDPPYGIREKTGYCEDPPLVQLVKCIAKDRDNNKRLLKKSGRLVAFVPNVKGEDVALGMPSEDDLKGAGLELRLMLEQPLNDSLSRWLVEYKCVQ